MRDWIELWRRIGGVFERARVFNVSTFNSDHSVFFLDIYGHPGGGWLVGIFGLKTLGYLMRGVGEWLRRSVQILWVWVFRNVGIDVVLN